MPTEISLTIGWLTRLRNVPASPPHCDPALLPRSYALWAIVALVLDAGFGVSA